MSAERATDLPSLSRELASIAAEAATLVADDLRQAFRGDMRVDFKRDHHDPVTLHDRRAEERIREFLLAKVPGSTVVGEEAGRSEGSGGVSWYVDPIDGTANFARGVAFFCTSIGAVVDGRVVAGAIVDPMAGLTFDADLDGARLDGKPIRSTGVAEEAGALLITGYPSARTIAAVGVRGLERFGALVTDYGTIRRPGSAALSLAHVAAGWADAALDTSINAWDVCAGQLILTQAGGHYRPFGGHGWDQPGYAARTADLNPVALHRFVDEQVAQQA